MNNCKLIHPGLIIVLFLILSAGCDNNNSNNSNNTNDIAQTHYGYLKVENGQIIDEQQNVMQLKGFNVSGWLLNENWINPGFQMLGGDENENSLRAFLDSIYPSENMGKIYTDEFRNRFITKSDFEYWKSLGTNALRLNVSHFLLEQGENGFVYIDNAINWADELGIYIIIGLITVPGCANTLDYCNLSEEANLWTDANNFNKLNDLWLTIADRYKDKSIVAGYNLINEPNSDTHEMLKEAYRILIDTIRTVDQKHIIFLDGNNYAANFEVFSDSSLANMDNNLVYSFHLYSSSDCNILVDWEKDILDFIDIPVFSKVADQNVPIWLGEYAGDCPEWVDVVQKVLKDKGVAHESYYSPKCAGDNYTNSKCLSKMINSDLWSDFLTKTKDGALNTGWQSDPGLEQLNHSNFEYDQEKINAIF
jgi:hypothetical protein